MAGTAACTVYTGWPPIFGYTYHGSTHHGHTDYGEAGAAATRDHVSYLSPRRCSSCSTSRACTRRSTTASSTTMPSTSPRYPPPPPWPSRTSRRQLPPRSRPRPPPPTPPPPTSTARQPYRYSSVRSRELSRDRMRSRGRWLGRSSSPAATYIFTCSAPASRALSSGESMCACAQQAGSPSGWSERERRRHAPSHPRRDTPLLRTSPPDSLYWLAIVQHGRGPGSVEPGSKQIPVRVRCFLFV